MYTHTHTPTHTLILLAHQLLKTFSKSISSTVHKYNETESSALLYTMFLLQVAVHGSNMKRGPAQLMATVYISTLANQSAKANQPSVNFQKVSVNNMQSNPV